MAQTCSQIGSDSTGSKSLLSPSEKLLKPREKSSPSSSSNGSSPVTNKSSFKPYESCLKDSDRNSERKSSPNKTISIIQDSVQTKVSSPSTSPITRRTPVLDTATQPHPQSNPATSSPVTIKSMDPISSLKSLSLPPVSSAHSFVPNYPSLPLDVMASSLLSSHSLKGNMNPYLNYGRLKSSGIEGVVPVCRDPYCTSCQLSSHLLAASAQNGKPCPPGCTQCDIGKSPGFLPGNHGTTLAAAYAQAQLAALAAASQMPYICSWVGADAAYCGKRFLTSDELLQHLRTHTSDSLINISPHSLLNRTYPTPPLSPLSTARYHPYSKPPFLPPSLFPLQANPALHPAFTPYLFYNSKLGSTPHH